MRLTTRVSRDQVRLYVQDGVEPRQLRTVLRIAEERGVDWQRTHVEMPGVVVVHGTLRRGNGPLVTRWAQDVARRWG